MKNLHRSLFLLLPAVLFASCSSMQQTASVADDVYFMPSKAPAVASRPTPPAAQQQQPQQPMTDDYYDAGTSQDLGANRSYYDMTYNDPYYYNYGRFGFNTAPMGWQTGWNGPGWGGGMGWGGMGMGWGNSMGWGNGWNVSVGYGSGIYSGWNRPMWGYDPWGWNSPWGWNPYGGMGWGMGAGFGYGNYYSPWGNCYGCYAPVIIGDGTFGGSTVIAHRNSVGSGRPGTTGGVRRTPVRNPVGLAPQPNRNGAVTAPQQRYQSDRTRQVPITTPNRDRTTTPQRERSRTAPAPTRNVERSSPTRSPSFDGGGSRSAPSRDTGGGGGGSRTSPGRR